jgi:hypothetical protein
LHSEKVVMAALGYLPQYLAEIAGVALGGPLIVVGLLALIGKPPGENALRMGNRVIQLGPRATRLVAVIVLLLGLGIIAFSFLVDAEPPGCLPAGHWGTTLDQVVAAIWVVLLLGIMVLNLRKARK